MTRVDSLTWRSLRAAVALSLALSLGSPALAQDDEEPGEAYQPPRVESIEFRTGDKTILDEQGLLILSFTVYLPEGRSSGFVFDVERTESDDGILASGDLIVPEEDGSYKVETRWPVASGDCGAKVEVMVTVFDEEEGTPPAKEVASLDVPASFCEGLEFESFE